MQFSSHQVQCNVTCRMWFGIFFFLCLTFPIQKRKKEKITTYKSKVDFFRSVVNLKNNVKNHSSDHFKIQPNFLIHTKTITSATGYKEMNSVLLLVNICNIRKIKLAFYVAFYVKCLLHIKPCFSVLQDHFHCCIYAVFSNDTFDVVVGCI